MARSPFRDEEEAAIERVARLERENAELRAALAAAHRSKGRGAPARPTLAIALSVISAATVTGIVAARLPTPHERAMAPVAAQSRTDAQWRPITATARTLRAATTMGSTVVMGGEASLLRFGTGYDEGDDAVPEHWPAIRGIGGQRGHLFAVGERGTVLAEDTSRVWTPELTRAASDLNAVTWTPEGAFAAGKNGVILRRHAIGHGEMWEIDPSGTSRDLNGIARTAEGVYVVGASGTILVLRPGRTSWTEEPSGVAADLHAVFQQDGVLYAVGKGGTILRRARDGWVREASGTLHDLYAVGGDGQAIYAVGAAGTILRSAGAGLWHLEEAHTTGDLLCVAGSGELVYAAGENGTLLRRSF